MPKNLLAVDDSTTMRKVLEITFSGEDFQVSSAPDRAGCMAKLGENPNVVVIDTSLEGDDGYAICRDVRSKLPRAVIVMMASRYNPYDAVKGKDAGADDFVDKPFDTQQMIDKIKKLLVAKESAPEAAAPPPVAAPPAAPAAPPRAPAPPAPPIAARPVASPPAPPVAPAAPAKPFTPGPAPARSGTLMFSVDGPPMPAPPAATSSTAQTAAPPAAPIMAPRPAEREAPTAAPAAPAPAAPAPTAAPAPAPAAAAAVNGHMAPKLAAMGLSPAQAEAVMALSREVVERVVWEVVPQLAEAIIKEEIQRLTKEG